MQYALHNGTLIEETHIHLSNRAYLYGDGIFETIRIINGKLFNFENHFKRFSEGLIALKMETNESLSFTKLQASLSDLIQQSEINRGGKIRLSIDRKQGGTYKPISNDVDWSAQIEVLNNNEFILNETGLEIDIYRTCTKENNKFSMFKTKNAMLYVMASIEAQERNLDDVLILNNKEEIIECTASNLFLISNGILYTPALEDGCVAGTMRMSIINTALKLNMKVYECKITPQSLHMAEEVFVSNAIKGIQWVGSFKEKRYFHKTANVLLARLNEEATAEVTPI